MKKSQWVFYIGTLLITLVASFCFWWLTFKVIADFETNGFVLSFIFGVFLLSLISLFSYLNESLLWALTYGAFASLPILFFNLIPYSFFSFMILTLATFTLNLQTKISKGEFFRPNVGKSLNGLNSAFILLALSVCLIYYPNVINKSQNLKITLPEKFYQSLTKSFLTNFLEKPESSESVLTMAEKNFDEQIPVLTKQLNQQGITDKKVVEAELSRFKANFLKGARNQLKSFGTESNPLDPANLKSLVENQIETLIEPYRGYLPLTLTISLFFTLTFFAWLFTKLSLLFTLIFLKVLSLVGITTSQKETVEVSKIIFS